MGESKGEGGSWLYGILLILAGGFIALVGILDIAGVGLLQGVMEGLGLGDIYSTLTAGLDALYITIGAWGVIGGIGLIQDQEWGWGISLVVLSAVIATFLTSVIAGMMAGTWQDIMLWIQFVAVVIAAVGIVYLLMTKEKYA